MATARAWALIAKGADRQYGGNRGYDDDLRHVYRYDSLVANHRNVSAGDLVFIRDGKRLLGIAQVEFVSNSLGSKSILRCPHCGQAAKARREKIPLYRCKNRHEFDIPREEEIQVTTFAAHYSRSFVDTPDAIPVRELKLAALRPNDQLSIEEVDIRKLEHALLQNYPHTRKLLAAFYQGAVLDPSDAENNRSIAPPDATAHESAYSHSVGDERDSVLRQIRQRRGQQKFRNSLIRRYGARCMLTGCTLVDVLEAAHIWPYRGERDNHPENGLLLRADIHTLFDLNFIAIDPVSLEVAIAPALACEHAYSLIHAQRLQTPPGRRPAHEPLIQRWNVFHAKWNTKGN